MTRSERARLFADLHRGDEILVLPNAWDAASARVFELAGARAIATTSAGVAAAHGYPDGERIGRDLLLAVVERITHTVAVPVSVDVENGYGASGAQVAETVRGVIEAGGVGINVEDAMLAPDLLVEKLAAARAVAEACGVPLFVNARTDVYLAGEGTAAERFAEAVRRLRAYEAAGADGLFVPGLADPATIAALRREIRLPLNIMAGAGVPSVKELARLGVARVSVGSGPMRAALGLTRRIADQLLGDGTYLAFLAGAPAHAEVDAMFAPR